MFPTSLLGVEEGKNVVNIQINVLYVNVLICYLLMRIGINNNFAF